MRLPIMRLSATRLIVLFCLALAFAAPLAACGKRGDPTLPPGQSDDYPRRYPQPY